MPVDRIDTHFHMLPDFWTEALVKKVGKPMWGVPEWSYDSALGIMDRLETETALISLATPSVSVWDGQEQVDLTRKVNDFAMTMLPKAKRRLGY